MSWPRPLLVLASIAAAAVVAGCGGQTGGSADPPAGLIAFTHQNKSGKDQIFVIQTDGTARRALTTKDSLDPVWSPDGKRLAFLDHDQRLLVMNADGSGKRVVSQERGFLAEDEIASWSPDGKQLVFGAKLDMGADHLFVVNADGTGKRSLGVRGDGPDWSPDGKQIVFTDGEGLIAVISADGGGLRRLTDFGCSSDPPRWSPNGKKIAVITSVDCGFTASPIAVMNPDGSGMLFLTHRKAYYGAPSWSPDGRQIVFSRGPELGAIGNLYIADADGGHVRRITTDGGNFDPSWGQSSGS
jgi:TolB protein